MPISSRAQTSPPVIDFGPTNEYGRNIQQSMRWMADSPPSNKRTVNVLFYGQSITQEIWSRWLADYIRQRYTNANLIITNRAVGYNAELLVKTADADLYPFYPDLVIYHNYGSIVELENIVARTRARTTADILLQNDHPIFPEDLTESTDTSNPTALSSDAWRAYVALPEIAERYGAEIAEVRTVWKNYLLSNDLVPSDMLRDVRHPNLRGNYLMRDLLEPYFRTDPSFDESSWKDSVKTFEVGQDQWVGDSLTMPFTGNRVDLVYSANSDTPVRVFVDGKRPDEFPELYNFTRVPYYPGTSWPCVTHIGSRKPLIPEQWTATVLSYSSNAGNPFVRFAVHGSETGDDGEGVSNQSFVSNSGRVIIEPGDWLMLSWSYAYFPVLSPLPTGYEIKWESRAAFKNEVVPSVPDPTLESTETIVHGLSNGNHILKLVRSGPVSTNAIRAVRVYNPLARIHPTLKNPPEITEIHVSGTNLTLQINPSTRYVMESAVDWKSGWKGITAPIVEKNLTLPITPSRQFFRLRRVD